ncbi:hypothetical protein PR048_001987 [Dryococelus australis]|uniref:DUF7869 domain-containing protein n=1 Tax=Dryococelus australis TaxID=614101 RepID=A0ABQ9IIW7_9NEOP|nr:hypothetical protein PR048_001987 [Dryococelus australis]
MKADIESTNQPHVLAICFDYMQNIQLPQVPVQETFYLRQLTVNVFSIHNITNNTGNIYIYHESITKKGPNEVFSFLCDYLKDVPPEITEIHLYLDNCSGQNKNHSLSKLLLVMTDTRQFNKIEHFFPLRGHSVMPCDQDFGIIKRYIKRHDRFFSVHELTE